MSSATPGARGELDQHAPVERALDRADHDRRAEHAPARDQRQRQRRPRAERLVRRARGISSRTTAVRRAEAVDLERLLGQPRQQRGAGRSSWCAAYGDPDRRAARLVEDPLVERDHQAFAEAVEDDVAEDPQQLVDLERPGQPRARGAEDLQAPGRRAGLARSAASRSCSARTRLVMSWK